LDISLVRHRPNADKLPETDEFKHFAILLEGLVNAVQPATIQELADTPYRLDRLPHTLRLQVGFNLVQ